MLTCLVFIAYLHFSKFNIRYTIMKIIVGLGNPEEKYLKTFHNMGYIAVGDVAAELNVKFKKKECEAFTAEANLGGEKVIIARPVTYMNNSGRAVKQLLAKYKATVKDLVVIYDDYDIPKGSIRIRPSKARSTCRVWDRCVTRSISSSRRTARRRCITARSETSDMRFRAVRIRPGRKGGRFVMGERGALLPLNLKDNYFI